MNSIAIANPSIAATLIRQNNGNTRSLIPNNVAIVMLSKVAAILANVEANVVTGGDTAIAAIIARIVQSTTTTNPSKNAQTLFADMSIILTELLNPKNDAAAMDLNLNQLLNSALSQEPLTQPTQNALAQLPAELLSKPQVIEALVLQNTLLPASDNSPQQTALPLLQLPNANTAAALAVSNTLYRVNVQWQNRVLQLLSSEPLPSGSRVPLQITAGGQIALLSPAVAAKLLSQQILSQQNTTPLTSFSQRPTPAQTIQQSLRELLPRQEALHTLVPLLQKFVTPTVREQLPQPVFKALAQLLQALPKPAQVTNAENLKQTLNNSGSFFEARIARALMADPKVAEALSKSTPVTNAENLEKAPNNSGNASTAQSTRALTVDTATTETLSKIFAGDIKAQISTLLEIIRKFTPDTPTHTATSNIEDDFIYTGKPTLSQTSPHNAPSGASSNHLDTLLTELSKLLQAGFARIQLNQLDSASARHIAHESQAPVPTWVLELPLRTPDGVDQLQLRIEQRRKQQQQQTRVQWNVEIAFDLHSAGKLAASLAIVDKTVSATLWAEHEQTHRRVRDEMDYLRAGLESVGVKVTEMQCRLGLPAPRSRPISQQLVDIHT